jgi:Uma2 family endonuclease
VHLAPDAFVVFGVANHDRDTFRTWDGGAVPSVVFEIPSNTTRRDDTVTKRAVYQDVWEGNEYFLFDPLEDYLDPSLQGFRRVRGEFQPIPANADGSVPSRRLGLSLSRTGAQLTLRDTATGAMVLTEQEAEIARLKAELDSLKKRK